MIRKDKVNELAPGVIKAVGEAFDLAMKNQKNPGDFVLFLQNGHTADTVSPGLKGLDDADRLEFLNLYLKTPYDAMYNRATSKSQQDKIVRESLHYEMMIYTHCWESYPNLAGLKQLANLAASQPYDWEIVVPDFSKHDYIRKEIRDVFKKKKLKIEKVMSCSYHSQLRNAFAHSQYSLRRGDRILLGNYKGESWQMKEIMLGDWEERFIRTALLFNVISRKKNEYKKQIGTQQKEVAVWIPEGRGHVLRTLLYDEVYNRFYYKQKGD